jgi:hypothetical protein
VTVSIGGGGVTVSMGGGGGVTVSIGGGGGVTVSIGGGGVTASIGGGVTVAGGGGMVAGSAAAFGVGIVTMTTPTIMPIITNITITIRATGGPLGALTAGAAPEFIYNLNSEINSSKFL